MIDTRENFWRLEPTLTEREDGSVIVQCGDCPWNNDRPEGLLHAEDEGEALALLGVHYLASDRHTEIDREALADA